MADRTYLDWPFFDDAHRTIGGRACVVADRELAGAHDPDPFVACRATSRSLAQPAG
jgi:acyl-CoA dehydrogenase